MRTNPIDPTATRKLTASLVATLQHADTDELGLRDAVVAALAQTFEPEHFQELVAALAGQQRAVCETKRRMQIAAAIAGLTDGRLDAARQAAEAAVRLDFADAESHHVLAEILEQAGDVAEAHTEYLLAMHLGWDSVEADAAIARTGPKAPEAENGASPAESRYGHALKRAISSLEGRDLPDARRHARAAVALDPARPEGFNLLGILAELAGRRGEARTQYLVASALAPAYRPALRNLAGAVRPWTERGPLVW